MLLINEVFNEGYYLETNPEAAESVAKGEFTSGLDHFLSVGIDQNLRFSPFIDLDYYKRIANPDLSNFTNREALDRLLEVGIEEGRVFSQFVDLEFYKEANPDIADLSNSEALLHLQNIGLEEGRQFSSFVNLEEYRSFNPELSSQSLSDAFAHLATFFAPDDEGRIRIPLSPGRVSITDEVDIVTPEMLTGLAEATITYSKSANTVIMEFDFEGLPYKLDLTRPEDASTPYNQLPVSVEDGKWQIWIISNFGNLETTFWYDGQTGQLIDNEFDIFDEPPAENTPIDVNDDGIADTPVQLPTTRMVSTPLFEGNPDGTGHVTFEYAYDQLLDDRGTGGVYFTFLPYNLNKPNEIGPYYTEGGLPISEAPSWDDVLASMRNSTGIALALSLEPDPKPDYLNSRNTVMIGSGAFYPTFVPEGVVFEPVSNIYRFAEPSDLVTHENEPSSARLAAIEAETETVFGDSNSDVLDAADPSDDFDGNRDTVFAGAGDDLVDASQATALLFPSTAGRNHLFGGTGLDELLAGTRDRLFGGVDHDILDASAGTGKNRLYGGDGNDELLAGEDDRLFGGNGDDLLNASLGSGGNRLYGQNGNDTFSAGSGDRLYGGDGDDAFFVTDGGDNLITGGAGADAFWIATGELITTANTITDFELDEDVIGVAGLGANSIDDLEFSQVNNDAIISFAGFDLATLLNTQVSDLQSSDVFVFA